MVGARRKRLRGAIPRGGLKCDGEADPEFICERDIGMSLDVSRVDEFLREEEEGRRG